MHVHSIHEKSGFGVPACGITKECNIIDLAIREGLEYTWPAGNNAAQFLEPCINIRQSFDVFVLADRLGGECRYQLHVKHWSTYAAYGCSRRR
jgi:hypothetical protein